MRPIPTRPLAALCLALLAAACAAPPRTTQPPPAKHSETLEHATLYPRDSTALNHMIAATAKRYSVPVALVHRVIQRESSYNPGARNGPYYGLMQILPQTARTMGYSGPPRGLLDAQTNLTYGVKYLRGAWLLSGGNFDRAVMWYARGYYYEARRRGMLEQTGLG